METKSLISLMIILQAIFIYYDSNFATAQKPNPGQQVFKCNTNGNFKSDKLLEDRESAFKTLYKNFASIEAYSGYESGNVDGVGVVLHSYGLCPPNIKKEACVECINNTISYLKKGCPKQKEGVAWTVLARLNCMVRYADYSFKGKFDEWTPWTTFSTPNSTSVNAGELEKGLNNLANKLKEPTAKDDNKKKYETGSITYGPGSRTLFGSMQCIPDIEKEKCMKCLSDATNNIHNCCSKKAKGGGIAISTNCYYWYSHEKIFS